MLRYSTGIVCMMLLASVAQAQQVNAPVSPMPSMPAMPGTPVVQVPAAPPAMAAPTEAVAPAAQLPEVDVPSVAIPSAEPTPPMQPEPVAALPVAENAAEKPTIKANPVTDPSTFVSDPNAEYSFGSSDLSLLFTPSQARRMKNVLTTFEAASRNRAGQPINIVEEIASVPEEVKPIEEPAIYPVYTLKSIAYRNARDWTVWIGDLRITPGKNQQDVRVLGVSPDRAQFLWKPAYTEAIQLRSNSKRFATTDKVKHKMTHPNTAIFDAAAGQATFTLKPNQTFAPGYMATFEGKVASPTLESINPDDVGVEETAAPAEAAPQDAPAPAADTSANNPDNLDALLKSQQQNGPVKSLFQRTMQAQPAPLTK